MPVSDNLIATLRSWVSLVASQTAAGIDRDSLLVAQSDAFLVDLRNAGPLTIDDISAVSTELSSGPWTQEQMARLATAVGNSGGQPKQKAARENQTMNYVESCLTDHDWTCVQDAGLSVEAKLQVLAERLWRLGVTCPSIPLVKRVVAIVTLCGLPAESDGATPDTKKKWCTTLKGYIKGLDKQQTWPGQHIKRYVDAPSDLPTAVYDYAYSDGAPSTALPASVTTAALDAEVTAFGCKRSHNTLQPRHTTSASPCSALGMQFIMRMAPLVQQLMGGSSSEGGSAQGGGCPISYARPTPKRSPASSLARSGVGTLSASAVPMAGGPNPEQDLSGFDSQLSGASAASPPQTAGGAGGAAMPRLLLQATARLMQARPWCLPRWAAHLVQAGPWFLPRSATRIMVDLGRLLEEKLNRSAEAAGSNYRCKKRPAAAGTAEEVEFDEGKPEESAPAQTEAARAPMAKAAKGSGAMAKGTGGAAMAMMRDEGDEEYQEQE
ncbi:unnamed protein product [Prorocentrum cordatum]|uniref:Uncharacterized protein n=1 Tax=Prorocentrum cordatum TaxID=2364126 RepID=A0ABN9PAG5_9DINO|nr:unnamed protein product [Polarella glacialis]